MFVPKSTGFFLASVLTYATASPLPSPGNTPSTMEKGVSYAGRATFYNVGLGACGKKHTNQDPVIALNASQFSRGACGKWVRLTYKGKSARGFVGDKCDGCKFGSVDLSPSLFKQLGALDAGFLMVSWSLGASKRSDYSASTESLEDAGYAFGFDSIMEPQAEDTLLSNREGAPADWSSSEEELQEIE